MEVAPRSCIVRTTSDSRIARARSTPGSPLHQPIEISTTFESLAGSSGDGCDHVGSRRDATVHMYLA